MNYPDASDLHEGKFTDGDPVAGIAPSIDSANYTNAVYDELIAIIQAGGLTPNNTILNQAAISIQKQIYGQRVFAATGSANDIVLVSKAGQPAIESLAEHDQIKVQITTSNTDVVTIQLDGLAAFTVANITAANQLFSGALATFTYLDDALYLTEQINPKTGNATRDIGKLVVDTTDVLEMGEIALNGATLNRADFPVFWNKIQATSNLMDQTTKEAEPETYAGFYGDGDGSTTFTLPDLRGEFIRMADEERGMDEDRILGSWQEDEYKLHGHPARYDSQRNSHSDGGGGISLNGDSDTNYDAHSGVPTSSRGQQIGGSGGNETRPRNIAYFAKTRV